MLAAICFPILVLHSLSSYPGRMRSTPKGCFTRRYRLNLRSRFRQNWTTGFLVVARDMATTTHVWLVLGWIKIIRRVFRLRDMGCFDYGERRDSRISARRTALRNYTKCQKQTEMRDILLFISATVDYVVCIRL